MFLVLAWLFIAVLLAIWSFGVWALHAAAGWTLAHAGGLASASTGGAGPRLPEWLAPWLPPEAAQWLGSLVSGLAPWLDSLVQAMPELASGLGVVSWIVWGLGSLLLLLLGAGLHSLIAPARGRSRGTADPVTRRPLAID